MEIKMKFKNLFSILPKYLSAYGNLKPEQNYLKQVYWERECRDHPTNKHCLIYCD